MSTDPLGKPDPVWNEFAIREPAVALDSGSTVLIETVDARAGTMQDHQIGSTVDLPPFPKGRGNPVTGPVVLRGSQPGDTVAVTVDKIQCISPGWVGAHARPMPAGDGRVPRSRARICQIADDQIVFGDDLCLPLKPMIGTIATTPPEPLPCASVGRHGGNLDHPIVSPGARILLPVFTSGAYIYIGDVHAAQGDGELSGVAVEVAARLTLTFDLLHHSVEWPWVETSDTVAVLTAAADFETARRYAVDAMMTALERAHRLEPAEALALVSAAGNLRLGHASGSADLTLRLELPRTLAPTIAPGAATR
jgi:acetamidase/formamidase